MKPLSIAMVCDMIPGQPGGSFISTLRFAELLTRRGHHVVILAARDSHKPPVSIYSGVPIYQFPSLPMPGSHRYYFYSFPKAREIRDIFAKEKTDLVHIMFPSYSCWLGARVAKEMGIPVVAHSHTQPENVSIFLPAFLRTAAVNGLINRYLGWFVSRGKTVICPSELGRSILHKYDPDMHIEVVSNGIDLSRFSAGGTADMRMSFMKKYELSPDDKHILFIGRLTHEKGAERLIRAMPLILKADPRIHAELIGTGPLRDSMEKLCAELGVTGSVTFMGRISDEDLLSAYNACDLFVLPSMVELEGMVVLEAMACGKPVLIADSPESASRYFVEKNGFLFEPLDPADLSAKALAILDDEGLRRRMSEESLLTAKRYDISKSVDKLENIYHSVIEHT